MKNELVNQLLQSEQEVIRIINNLTIQDFQKSINENWSIGLQFRHILDIEKLIFESAQTENSELEFTNKSEQIHHIMLVSERKFKAPEVFQPKEPITSTYEFVSTFKQLRTEIYNYIENEPLEKMSDDGHPLFGALSKKDWFIFLQTHTLRHLKQIEYILEQNT